MPGSGISLSQHTRALAIGMALVTLVMLCAWGGWTAAQPDLSTFTLPGARDMHQERLGPGLRSLVFSYDDPVMTQSRRLRAALEQHGWQASRSLEMEDCDGPCLLGEVTLIYTRASLFNLVHEVVTIDQRGAGPFHVRVVLRRCIRLPAFGCWPPG